MITYGRQDVTDADITAVDEVLSSYWLTQGTAVGRYEQAVDAYARAATQSENSLAWLNVGQAAITNLMLGGGMAYVAWGWSRGQFSAGDVVLGLERLSETACSGWWQLAHPTFPVSFRSPSAPMLPVFSTLLAPE